MLSEFERMKLSREIRDGVEVREHSGFIFELRSPDHEHVGAVLKGHDGLWRGHDPTGKVVQGPLDDRYAVQEAMVKMYVEAELQREHPRVGKAKASKAKK